MHPHISVLPEEVQAAFQEISLSFFVDCTLGLGGHSEAILKAHPEIQLLLGIDQDQQALKYAKERLRPWHQKTAFVQGNFRELKAFASQAGLEKADGILLDLGVSSLQLDTPERGFSMMKEGPLDMRMDSAASLTAEEIINCWSKEDLVQLFRDGEEAQFRQAAHLIVAARVKAPIKTTTQLTEILRPLGFKQRRKSIHPATLVFQALRIEVNKELEVVTQVLPQAIDLLAPSGILAVISFHSLEDRIVKRYFMDQASDKVSTSGIGGVFIDKEPVLEILTRKPIVPSAQEEEANPRSRSAKLRIARKIAKR